MIDIADCSTLGVVMIMMEINKRVLTISAQVEGDLSETSIT